MRKLLILACVAVPVSAFARKSVHLHARVSPAGAMVVEMKDDATGQTMETELAPERARSLDAWLVKHGFGPTATASAPVAEQKGCGLGDFFSGKC